MIQENRRSRAHLDWPLLLMSVLMGCFGVLAVTVATFPAGGETNTSLLNHIISSDTAVKQCIFLGVATPVVLITLINVPYEVLRKTTRLFYWGCNILVAVVFVVNRAEGVKAWLDVLWGYTIQPSEFAKLTTLLMLARVLSRKEQPMSNLKEFVQIMMIVGIPSVIILMSGEMGSLLVILFMFVVMLYFSNVSMKLLLWMAAAAIVAILLLYGYTLAFNSDNYRLARILAFLNPELYSSTDAYQMRQSQMTIGSGGLHGIGIFVDGSMSQLNYTPADWTDFIFATIGEAWGFVGCTILIVAFFAIILRMLYLAAFTQDKYGRLIIVGVMGMLLFHVFENIGMTLGLMPITGIPLPFVSYGGSNMVTNMGGIGLVLNVVKNRSLTRAVYTPQLEHSPYLIERKRR